MTPDVDAIILRHIFVQRFASGLSERIIKSYSKADREMLSFIREWADDASDADIESLLTSNKRNKRVKELFDKIGDTEAKQIIVTGKFMYEEMRDLAHDESKVVAVAMGNEALKNKIDPDKIIKHPVMGVGLAAEWKSVNNKWYDYVRSTLIDTAQSKGNLAQSIKGTRDQNYKDGVIITRNNTIENKADTRVNGVVNNIRGEVYKEAKVKEEDYLATLDHRTCLICGTNEIEGPYALGFGPHPPVHPRCRCVRIPSGNNNIERPYVEDHRSLKDIPRKQRVGKVGTGIFDYEKFFERQKDQDKLKILGPARWELYKTGDYRITDFVHDRSQRLYSVADLNRL